jgi:hypothetical protein
MEPIERRMQLIVKKLGGDACHNVDRIMRLPGTVNVLGPTKIRNGRKPALAELIEFHDDRIYDLEQFPSLERSARTANGHARQSDRAHTDIDRIRAALVFIPADDYNVYVRIGMALKAQLGEKGFGIYLEWAATSIKFDASEIRHKWASFAPDGAVTIATLFGLARDHGWRDQSTANGTSECTRNGGAKPEDQSAWDDPDQSLLDDRRGELPEFPIQVLDPALQQWLARAARGAGVAPDHVAIPLLAIASSLIGSARRVRACSSWSVPLSLWTAIVGFSGSGKTPGLDVSRRALSRIERSRRSSVDEQRLAHEQRAAAAKAALKKWNQEVEKAIENGRPTPPKPPEADCPGPFVAPRFYVSDVTIERLAVLLGARPCGMLMICDELAGLFSNMSRYSNGSDREFWLEAWNGGHHIVERLNRPPVVIEHLLVGMTGGFQPDKLVRSLAGADDGMYARVLFSWPGEPTTSRCQMKSPRSSRNFRKHLCALSTFPPGKTAI